MNNLPFDIVSYPAYGEHGINKTKNNPKNKIKKITNSSCEVQIFNRRENIETIIGERTVFDYKQARNDYFIPADIGGGLINPGNFIPAQEDIGKTNVLRCGNSQRFLCGEYDHLLSSSF